MIIEVTRKHIRAGTPVDPFFCPIALALQEQFPGEKISVGFDSGIAVGAVIVPHTTRSRAFINRFDSGKRVQPFRFRLMVNA